jgi:hypothetical protein
MTGETIYVQRPHAARERSYGYLCIYGSDKSLLDKLPRPSGTKCVMGTYGFYTLSKR